MSILAETREPRQGAASPLESTVRLPRLLVPAIAAMATVLLVIGLAVSWRMGRSIRWSTSVLPTLPLLLGLGVGSYGSRFLRWHLLVRRLAPDLPVQTSARIYMAGFGLGLTPGRLGEFLKFSLLREASGVPEIESVSVFPLERATEAAGFFGLVLTGGVIGHLALRHVGASVLLSIAVLPVLALLPFLYGRLQRSRGDSRNCLGGRGLEALLRGLLTISGFRTVLPALGCAALARCFDAFLFYSAATAVGLHLELPWAAFAWGLAGLVGGLSLLPAGVGAVEASLVATVLGLGGDGAMALAAALLSRIMTLWLWVPPGLWFAFRSVRRAEQDASSPSDASEDRSAPATPGGVAR